MFNRIKLSLSLFDKKSSFLIKFLSMSRVAIVTLDAVGIATVGLLLAGLTSRFTPSSSSNNQNLLNIGNFYQKLSITQLVVISLGLFLSKSILSILFSKFMADVLAKSEASISSSVFEKVLQDGNKVFTKYSTQNLIFALNFSASYGITNLLTVSAIILSEGALLIAIAILFVFVNQTVAIGIIIYFAVIGFIIYKILGPKMQNSGKLFSDSASRSSTAINDAVSAYREIFTLGKQQEFKSKFQEGRIGFARATANVSFYSALPRYLVESALIIGAAVLTFYVFTTSSITEAAGILGVFLTGGLRIMASMLPLQNSFSSLRQLIAQSEPFFTLVEETKSIRIKNALSNAKNYLNLPPLGVSFENVSYSYPGTDKEAIKNFSLKITPGSYVALIGPSGSGKSTFADLLIGLIKPSSGNINFETRGDSEVRIGYVPQSAGIIKGTILDNITLNINSKIFDAEKLKNALIKSHLEELVSQLSDGVYSDLGANSDSLSGGQLQRISLARALYSVPNLIILDEATSALDPETESAFSETLLQLKGRCTIVVIAHRLSTVKNADCVFVIDNGQVLATGKFNELAKSNELVARYVELSQLNID